MGVRFPATEVTDRCELPCGCWELNLGPLEEQSVLLNTEPSLQPHSYTFISSECLGPAALSVRRYQHTVLGSLLEAYCSGL